MAGEAFCLGAANAMGSLMVDYLWKPVGCQIRCLFRPNKILEELLEQKGRLSREKTQVQEDVKEARRHTPTQVIEDYVEDWLIRAKNALNDVQSLESRIEENEKSTNWCCRYRLSKEMDQKTEDIRELVNMSSEFKRYGHRAELPGLEFLKIEGYVASESLVSAFNDIMEALKDDGVNTIGVRGMGGVGKTTLVKEVASNAKELQLCGKAIIVAVSQKPDIEKIQDKIADFLDLTFEKKSKEGKAEELWLRLRNEEKKKNEEKQKEENKKEVKKKEDKVLIILDDVWEELNLTEIGIPVRENGKGCIVILTTRKRSVCESMKCRLTVTVDVLDEGEAWKLFEMNASLASAADPDIIEVAKEVAKECGGLPIAIVPLARALRSTKDLNGWKLAFKKLKSSRLMEIENVLDHKEKNAYKCLELSYNHLRRETTKRCFLLCALYPEDYSVDVEGLVRYAWGLRIYQNAESIQDVREEVFEAIKNLKDSCLLLEDYDKERHIKMHDVVRDVAMWIASREDNGLVIKPGVKPENERFKQKLEILLDLYDNKTPVRYFEGMPELKVLSLKTASYLTFSLNAIKSLKKLRALELEGFKCLEGISDLASLTELEILSLKNSEFREPIDKLGDLKNLKVFDLRGCHFISISASKLIRRLGQLEELYLGSGSNDAILEVINSLGKLASLSLEKAPPHFPGGFTFPGLERYEINIYRGPEEAPETAISSRSLRISSTFPFNVIEKLLWNVEFLDLYNIEEEDLKCLIGASQMKKAGESHKLLLSKLKRFWLRKSSYLEYIWKMPTQHVSLQSLEVVKIYDCVKLKSLFSLSLAQSLLRLQELVIDECHELAQMVEVLEGDEQDKCLCFPELRYLQITFCHCLEYIFPNSLASQGFPKLQKLTMMGLSELKQICRPGKQPQELFPSLTELYFSDCEKFIDTVHFKHVTAALEGIQLSKFKKALFCIKDHNLIPDVDLKGLNELTVLQLGGSDSLECLVDTRKENVPNNCSAFCKLEKLSLSKLSGLKRLCNGQFPKDILQNLKELNVEECEQLQELFDCRKENQAQLLSKLELLRLTSLPELGGILKGPAHHFHLQSLKFVVIDGCKKLESIFSPSLVQSLRQLEELQIDRCDELKTLFAELENDGGTKSNNHLHPLCLPKLRSLIIISCPTLEYFLPITLAQGLSQLENLEISGSHELKTLFAELENDGGEIESSGHPHPLCLPRLRTLFISNCKRLEYVLPITSAQGLQQLELVEVYNCTQLKQVFGVGKEDDGVEACMELPHLKHLELKILPNLSSFGPENYFVKAPSLESVSVWGSLQLTKFTIQQEVKTRLSLWGAQLFGFEELLSSTKYLRLKRIMGHKNLIPDADLERLTSLELSYCEDLECLADTTTGEYLPTTRKFTNLKELVIQDDSLKMLCKGVPPKGFLQNLETLTLRRCMNIVSLYLVARNLKTLSVCECENLEEVFPMDETESNTLCLPTLETLEVIACPTLKYVFPLSLSISLPSLKVVRIEECNELEYLLSSSFIESLRLMEELCISNCDKLESVFTELECTDDETKSNKLCVPNLITLEITGCRGLKYVLPRIIQAPSLKRLAVSLCPQLSNFAIQEDKQLQSKDFEELVNDAMSCNNQLRERSPNLGNSEQLFQPPDAHNVTLNLETMILWNLVWLRYLWKGPIQAILINLRELEVCHCNRLAYIFPVIVIRNLPNLSELRIGQCENLKQIIGNDDMSATSSQGLDQDGKGVKNEKEMLMIPQLKELELVGLASLMRFSPLGYHLVFPSLDIIHIEDCSQMITSFTQDSDSNVHAKTEARGLDDTGPSELNIQWRRGEDDPLPSYVEEADEISAMK